MADRDTLRWYAGVPIRGDEVVADAVEQYVPAALAPELWELVRPAAIRFGHAVPAATRRQVVQRMRPLAQYLAWRHQVGLGLDEPTSVFRFDDIERFILIGCDHLAIGTQATYRSTLRSIGEHVVGSEVACPDRTRPIAKSDPHAPYSTSEIGSLLAAISGQRTGFRRHNLEAIALYGLGAGLPAGEMGLLVGSDHEVDSDGAVLVHVPGPRARTVPVLRAWEAKITEFAALAGDRPVIRGARQQLGHGDISRLCERDLSIGTPRLSPARLRVTWIVSHLAAGVPLPILAEAAGITTAQLARCTRYLAPVPAADAASLLRGARVSPRSQAVQAVREAIAEIHSDVIIGREAVRIDDQLVREVAWRLDASGVVEQIEKWAVEDAAGPGGAPEQFSKRTLLVAMFVSARIGWSMLATDWTRILRVSISDTMRAELGVPDLAGVKHPEKALYRQVRTRFHAIRKLIDYSELPKNRRVSDADIRSLMRDLSPERQAVLRKRQTWLINEIIRISHRAMPRALWDQWLGGVAVDATYLGTYAEAPADPAKEKDARVIKHSADPDAWWDKEGRYGFEENLAFMGGHTPDERGAFPKLLLGMAPPHIPGESPGRNGYIAVEQAASATTKRGPVAGDDAYHKAHARDFALPVQHLGYDYLVDYKQGSLGQQGVTADGALMVDGRYYCPAIPPTLITATRDHRNNLIDRATWQARLQERRAFELRPKQRPRPDGTVRMLCPAAGTAPTAVCDHKPAYKSGRRNGKRRIDLNHHLAALPPAVCRQQSITISREAGDRYVMAAFRHGTEEWRRAYQLRSTDEGAHGVGKDPAFEMIESASRRRIRGQAATALITSIQWCAVNLRRLASFAEKAVADPEGVPRTHYARRKPTTAEDRVAPTPEPHPPD